MSALPTPAPAVTLETEQFWVATARGELMIPRCNECATFIWYPRRFCAVCAGQDVSWVKASGRGTVYSFTIVRRGPGPYAEASPFVLAYVELEEGPRIMTNVVDCAPEDVAVGMPVEVVFHDTGQGTSLFRFRPVA